MKKRILSLLLAVCMAFGLGVNATAVEMNSYSAPDRLRVLVDGTDVKLNVPARLYQDTTYVPYEPVVKAIFPAAAISPAADRVVITAPGLNLTVYTDHPYVEVNGCFLSMPYGVLQEEGTVLIPARVLGTALGAAVEWNHREKDVSFTSGGAPIPTEAAFYNQDDLYWLSHIINAESGNQPLEGKIAVGNVVLNRVASPQFPNDVKSVIFQRGQFTPVANGAIHRQPNEQSIVAAKLCLSGANSVGNALYFLNPRTARSSWAARHRPFVATIGAHAFYA